MLLNRIINKVIKGILGNITNMPPIAFYRPFRWCESFTGADINVET